MTLIYFIPIILAIAWSIKYDRQEEFDESKSHRFWLLYVILSLITGLSYALGGDKQQYMTEFADYSSDISDLSAEIENGITDRGQMPIWVTINFFAKVFFDSFYIVQIIEAFFINFAVFYTCKKYTQHVFLFILLYCFTFTYFSFNTEVMREGFAIGFSLFAVEAYFRRKYPIAILLMCVALLCHVSAIVMLTFPFMVFKITAKRFPWIILTSVLFWVASNKLFSSIVSTLLGQEGALIAKIITYSSFSSGGFGSFVSFSLIYIVSPFFLMYYGIQRGSQDEDIVRRKERWMQFFLFVAIIIPSFPPLSRFLNYSLVFFLCMTTDTLFTLFAEKNHFVSKILCTLLFWGYTTFQYLAFSEKANARMSELWFPYTCILNEDYNRYHRQKIHLSVTDGDKDVKNTREVED